MNDDDVRHLIWLRDRLGSDLLDAVVVTTGDDRLPDEGSVAQVGAR